MTDRTHTPYTVVYRDTDAERPSYVVRHCHNQHDLAELLHERSGASVSPVVLRGHADPVAVRLVHRPEVVFGGA